MRLARRLIVAAVIVAMSVWLATAVDWTAVLAWLETIWQTVVSSVSTAYEALVALGLIPDAVHPENAAIHIGPIAP